jgi:tyrosyl-tRNA synthetase
MILSFIAICFTFAETLIKMGLIEELKWRGMLQDIMPGTAEQLEKEPTTAYIGFDPTADSLHIGSLVPILLLYHLQQAGHKPIALVGGATGMVGDPSGKSEERNLLNEETLQKNIAGVRKQLEKYLDFSPEIKNSAEIVNNYDWFKGLGFIDFLRDVGKHITVNYMMSKDSVKKRIEGETGISYTEFAYQLMQGYDFYWLYQHKNCKLQMGGSDQWGNITTGTELIRRKAGGEGFAFTCPLITKTDGGKFGKTEKGNVWIDAEKTSPFQFSQFWLNAADADAEKWIKIFTLISKEEITGLLENHSTDPGARILQKRLAQAITSFVHGEEEFEIAKQTTEQLFGKQQDINLNELDEFALLSAMEGVPVHSIAASFVADGIDIVTFLAETSIFSSKGEARKMVQGGGISLNKEKISDINYKIDASVLLAGNYIVIQKGKKNYFLVKQA